MTQTTFFHHRRFGLALCLFAGCLVILMVFKGSTDGQFFVGNQQPDLQEISNDSLFGLNNATFVMEELVSVQAGKSIRFLAPKSTKAPVSTKTPSTKAPMTTKAPKSTKIPKSATSSPGGCTRRLGSSEQSSSRQLLCR